MILHAWHLLGTGWERLTDEHSELDKQVKLEKQMAATQICCSPRGKDPEALCSRVLF